MFLRPGIPDVLPASFLRGPEASEVGATFSKADVVRPTRGIRPSTSAVVIAAIVFPPAHIADFVVPRIEQRLEAAAVTGRPGCFAQLALELLRQPSRPSGHMLTGKLEVPGYRIDRRRRGRRSFALARDVCAPAVPLALVHHDESPAVVKFDSAGAVEQALKGRTTTERAQADGALRNSHWPKRSRVGVPST